MRRCRLWRTGCPWGAGPCTYLFVIGAAGLLLALVNLSGAPPALAGSCSTSIELVSRASDGLPANGDCEVPAVNGDGCIVAFKSIASNLASGTNTQFNVFVRDRSAGTTMRIPPTPEPNEPSFPPALNACVPALCSADNDGQSVAFASAANNLLPQPTPADHNSSNDIFAFDRISGKLESLTFADKLGDNFVGGGGADKDEPPSLSADGNLVAFTSSALHLEGTVTNENQHAQIYVHDRTSGHNTLVSVVTVGAGAGDPAPADCAGAAISGNGCVVAFYSDATGLVAGDTNDDRDVFVRNICTGTPPERVNVSSTGGQAVRPSDRPAPRFTSAVSYDGRYVVFASDQGGLDDVCPDPVAPCYGVLNVFVRDRCESNGEPIVGCTLRTMRVSKGANGEATTSPSQSPSINADGRFVAFQSTDTGLVSPPTNGNSQIFVVDVTDGIVRPPVLVSVSPSGEDGNGDSISPEISGDGSTIVFQSTATNLVSDSAGSASQIFAAPNPPTPTPTDTATPTATETPTPTNTAPTETPTPTDTPTPLATTTPTATITPTVVLTPTPTAIVTATWTLTPTTPAGVSSATPTPSGTATPTSTGATQTPAGSPAHTGGGGGGGGCSCGIDPGTSVRADPSAIVALAFPLVLRLLRNRTRRS